MPEISARGFGWVPSGHPTPSLRDLNFHIGAGERVLLLGPSGAGKSTLLAALAGVLATAESGGTFGELTVDGSPAERRTHSIGLVRQDPETNVVLARVDDELRFGAENLGHAPETVRQRAADAAQLLGIPEPLTRTTDSLSGGQKQRLAIAAIAAMRPDIWLLDEPTAQLDDAGAAQVIATVSSLLKPDDTLVLVDHQAEPWWPLITRVIALNASGEIVVDCSPERALTTQRSTLLTLGIWLPGLEPLPPTFAHAGELLLTVDNVTYGRANALGSAHLDIREGCATVVRGSNGAGKTTLALTAAGLLPPLSGTVRAEPAWAPQRRWRPALHPISWRSRELAKRIAFVFQQPDLQFVGATVWEEISCTAESAARADELLERFELTHLVARHPRSLSGGEKRRLSVATALASPARVIVADEPTFGQDQRTWQAMLNEFSRTLQSGRALLMPSHDSALADALSASVLTLQPLVPAESRT